MVNIKLGSQRTANMTVESLFLILVSISQNPEIYLDSQVGTTSKDKEWLPTNECQCPPSTGLTSLSPCLPLQYHFISAAVPWFKAQTYCRETYTDLATVFDIEDMNRLVNTAQDSSGGLTKKAWIGLHDNLTSWRWSFADRSYYRNWDFNQPDNFLGDQMCVKMLSGGVWEDSNCLLKNPFICYDGLSSDGFIDGHTDRC